MSKDSITVLVVEDEKAYADALQVGLSREGMQATVAVSGTEALELFAKQKPDIVLLDLMLPGVSGTDVCREIRKQSDVPVIMVTAKDSEFDKVLGLELGADDYITKPYSLREVVARIRAVLRRSVSKANTDAELLSVGPIEMNLSRHSVRLRGENVELPLREFELLEVLMTNAGRAVSRSTLMDEVWGYGYHGETKTLDVHMQRLRARIEDDAAQPRLITTIRGVGYRLELQPATK